MILNSLNIHNVMLLYIPLDIKECHAVERAEELWLSTNRARNRRENMQDMQNTCFEEWTFLMRVHRKEGNTLKVQLQLNQ